MLNLAMFTFSVDISAGGNAPSGAFRSAEILTEKVNIALNLLAELSVDSF